MDRLLSSSNVASRWLREASVSSAPFLDDFTRPNKDLLDVEDLLSKDDFFSKDKDRTYSDETFFSIVFPARPALELLLITIEGLGEGSNLACCFATSHKGQVSMINEYPPNNCRLYSRIFEWFIHLPFLSQWLGSDSDDSSSRSGSSENCVTRTLRGSLSMGVLFKSREEKSLDEERDAELLPKS